MRRSALGGCKRKPRKFRHAGLSPATIASRSISCPLPRAELSFRLPPSTQQYCPIRWQGCFALDAHFSSRWGLELNHASSRFTGGSAMSSTKTGFGFLSGRRFVTSPNRFFNTMQSTGSYCATASVPHCRASSAAAFQSDSAASPTATACGEIHHTPSPPR